MRYTLFGKSGLRVSELCLGTMTFGTEWALGADYATSKEVFDAYTEAGGNFIDTANRYTEGTSERWLGEFTASDRDHFVIATKYTLQDRMNDPNFSGNHRKNLMRSVRESLKRLQTDHIDLLWLHMWDFTTPVDEVLRGLDDLISRGMVHYIGISDTPAWIVSQANTLAELRGWTAFTGLQVEYSLLQRTPERDLLPMAKAFEMTVTPWGALGGGALTGKYLRGEQGRVPEQSLRRNDRSTAIAQEVVSIADEIGVAPAQIAIAWTRQKQQSVVPIIGARRAEQIRDTLGVLSLTLSSEHIERLNTISAIEPGFPHDFLVSDGVKGAIGNTQDSIITLRK
jgi:aryl-alcohol dehydrogenase-like predicted oxidoreductase